MRTGLVAAPLIFTYKFIIVPRRAAAARSPRNEGRANPPAAPVLKPIPAWSRLFATAPKLQCEGRAARGTDEVRRPRKGSVEK